MPYWHWRNLLGNVFFDTCVCHQPGIDLLTRVIPIDNILFASEMVGAVRGIDPETNHHYDDTRCSIDQVAALSEQDRWKIFGGTGYAQPTACFPSRLS